MARAFGLASLYGDLSRNRVYVKIHLYYKTLHMNTFDWDSTSLDDEIILNKSFNPDRICLL